MARQRHVRFTIPEPCNVPWDGMTPVDSGRRHCASCDKVIVDFSKMSDDELMLHFRHAGGKMCGRFDNRQLDRPIPMLPERTQKARWWRALALLPLILFSKSVRAQYFQYRSGDVPPDTVALAKQIITPDTLVAKQEQLAPDTTLVAQQPDTLQATQQLSVEWRPGFPHVTVELIVSGTMVMISDYCPQPYIMGDVSLEAPSLYKGLYGGKQAFLSRKPRPAEQIASPDPGKKLTDKAPETPEPLPPALPASNEITGILPEQRRKPWKS